MELRVIWAYKWTPEGPMPATANCSDAAVDKAKAAEAMAEVADTPKDAVGEAFAADLLSQWEGFGRFCREVLVLEPLTLLGALGLRQVDPSVEVLASSPEAKADEAKAAQWEANWEREWARRFRAPSR